MMIFSALADPTRFSIIEILATQGQLPVAQIGRQFTMSPPAISQHLKVLKEANLVQVEIKGQQRLYSLNQNGLSEIDHWVSRMKNLWEQRFDSLEALLKEEIKKAQLAAKEPDNDPKST